MLTLWEICDETVNSEKNPSDGCSHSALTASTCIWSYPRGAFFTLLEHYGVISYKVNKVHTLVHTLFSACNCSVPSQLRVKMHSKSPRGILPPE